MRLAIVDDESAFRSQITETINSVYGNADVSCFLYADGSELIRSFENGFKLDAVFLDIEMKEVDGMTAARKIRTYSKDIPIIFLTAKTTQKDVIEGFKLGADDYVTKPFSMDELLLRIHAVYNRTSQHVPAPTTYKLGSYTFDAPRHLLNKGNESRKLTSKEADLLLLLCENMNETLERTVALRKVWYEDSYFNARSMDVYITKLRKYFKDEPNVELVNVHGVGFKLLVKN